MATRPIRNGRAGRPVRWLLASDRGLVDWSGNRVDRRYEEVSEPDRLVMTVPGDAVTAITLTPRSAATTEIVYAFDVDEAMHATVEGSVDEVLARISKVLTEVA